MELGAMERIVMLGAADEFVHIKDLVNLTKELVYYFAL